MRLIDADKFIEYLGLQEEDPWEPEVGAVVSLEVFYKQKTACDIDEIILQLIEASKSPDGNGEQFVPLYDAIEIVKKMGLEVGD